MKKLSIPILLLIVGASLIYLFFFSGPQQETPSSQVTLNQSGKSNLEVSLGEEVSGLGISITPIEVLEDSRCPVDVECVWEGQVKIRTKIISSLGESEMIFITGNPITTGNEEITLTDIKPARSLEGVIAPQDYLFTFYVTKKVSP